MTQAFTPLIPIQPIAQEFEPNHEYVDRYTAAHFLIGVLLGWKRVSLPNTVALAVGWELIERPLKVMVPRAFPYRVQETLGNAVFDVAAWSLGWWLFDYWSRKKSLAKS